MSIFEDFYKKEAFIADRRIRKNNPQAYRLWRNRVIRFLEHCECQKVFFLRNIRQCHYDGFIAHITKGSSLSTLWDWKYALAKFFHRVHLDIQVQTLPGKQQAKRIQRARKRLLSYFDEATTGKIIELFEGII